MTQTNFIREFNDIKYLILLLNMVFSFVFLSCFLYLKTNILIWNRLEKILIKKEYKNKILKNLYQYPIHTTIIFTIVFLIIIQLINLPFDIWIYSHNLKFKIASATTSTWTKHYVLSFLVQIPSVVFISLALFPLIRIKPKTWWLILGLASGILLIGYSLYTEYETKLYYKYTLLNKINPALENKIYKIANKASVKINKIQVINSSKTTNSVNIFILGNNENRRMVIYDNMIKLATEEEIVAAAAHEIGHILQKNPIFEILKGLISALFLFTVLKLMLNFFYRYKFINIIPIHHPANLPLIFFIFSLIFSLWSPINNSMNRYYEKDADIRAVNLIIYTNHLESLYKKISKINLEDPNPPAWAVFLYYDHPPINERISLLKKN